MNKQTTYGIIAVLFIVSGATGLVYQIAWFKYLSLFLGNTTYAQTIVLATFMGGLAIGASVWGRRADAVRSPILLYAILELLIGLYCIVYPVILGLVKSGFVYTVHLLDLPGDSGAVLALKLLASLITLLFPTVLMGGTLPVLVRYLSDNLEDSGKNVATLYFLNSFGAVIGTLLGGFFLVPMVGLHSTVVSAGIVNVLIAAAASMLGWKFMRVTTPAPTPIGDQEEPPPNRRIVLAIVVAGISGLAAMIYEVSWVRLLIPVLGSSTYSYTLMLVAFILGITIGSWLVSLLIHRWKNLWLALAGCQLLVAVAMALTLPLYGRVPYYFWHVGALLARSSVTYWIFLSLQFGIGLIIMIVPTVFLGMSLPLASRLATRSVKVLGRSVGTVFSVNTIGTVIGALGAGLVLIPVVGVRHAMEIGVLFNLSAGVLLVVYDETLSKVRRALVAIPAISLASLTLLLGSDWNQLVAVSGVFREFGKSHLPPASFAEFKKSVPSKRTVFYKEGASATVAVLEFPTPDGPQDVLIINGKADASSKVDLPTQVLLGQVPMMLHPKPDTVLVIGFGSGVTVGSVLTHPVKRVEAVEISPEVIEASRYFEHVNNRPLSDPRTKVSIEDALAFLNLSPTRYDVIISEPSNPWIAGIGNLYTTEFFEQCKGRLNRGGLMVQWFHLYEIDDETFRLVVRTFQSVFPHVAAWKSLNADVLLVGSIDTVSVDPGRLAVKFQVPAVRRDLERIQIGDPATLISMEMVSDKPLREYAGAGPLNTEDKPLLEYWAPEAFYVNRGAVGLEPLDERVIFGRRNLLLDQWIAAKPLTEDEKLNIGLLHGDFGRGNISVGYSMLTEYLRSHPKDSRALSTLAELTEKMGRREESFRYLDRLLASSPNDPALMAQVAWGKFIRDRKVSTAFLPFDASAPEALLKRCIELTADTVDYYRVRLGDLYFDVQKFRPALDNYRKALMIRGKYVADPRVHQDGVLLQLAKCYRELGDAGRAAGYALQAASLNPSNEEAKDFFYTVYLFGGPSPRDTAAHR